MTEKRFEVVDLKIQDNAPKGSVYFLDMQGGVNALCSLINGLNDKSNRLEKENEQLKSEYKVLHSQYQDLKKFVENNFDEYLTQEKLNIQIIKLSDENEQLRDKCYNIRENAKEYQRFVRVLKKENEQLTEYKSKVLELLDEKIKHYGYKPFSAPVGQPMSVNFDADMDRIARLSELQHLKKELNE